jgi:hypothetical protein
VFEIVESITELYSRIYQFLEELEAKGSFASPEVLVSVNGFANSIEDEDYRAALFGGAGVRLCRAGQYELAERVTSMARGRERANGFRLLAEELAKARQVQQSLHVYTLARETVLAENHSTGIIQELEESAKNLAMLGRRDLAIKFWEDAIALAGPKQASGGHEGPESSGTLYAAVEALCGFGEIERARKIAVAIQLGILKDRALKFIEKYA